MHLKRKLLSTGAAAIFSGSRFCESFSLRCAHMAVLGDGGMPITILRKHATTDGVSSEQRRPRRLRLRLPRFLPLFHGDHDHVDHVHGETIDAYAEGGSNGVAVAEMGTHFNGHGGHSHGGGHSHTHFHLDVGSLKTRPTLIRLFLATMCVLALPLWRRSSRLEWAALGGISMFLAAVDVAKFAIGRLRVQFGELYMGWKAHSELASSTRSDSSSKESAREIDAITWIGAFVNIGLASFKFLVGIIGHSAAMIADAGHSLSDLMSDAVTLWAVRLSRLPPDEDHPYGHGRFEAIGSSIIAIMLMGAGYGIGNHSFETLRQISCNAVHAAPSRLTAIAAAVSIVTKETLYRATSAVGRRRNSQVLIANAWHHRTDAVSSMVALIAIVGSMNGWPMLDPIAGLMVAGMVALTGVQVCTDAFSQLTDAADYDVRRRVAALARQVPGVVAFDRVRARRMGPQTLVDLTIQTDDMISASAAQQVGQRVRWQILENMPFVADVMVSIAVEEKPCPALSSLRLQEEIEEDIRDVINKKLPEIMDVSKIMVHYINMVTTAEVFIRVDPNMRISDASNIARRAKKALSIGIHDLCSAEVHLDLVEAF